MVLRLDFSSEILAQKPKSAVELSAGKRCHEPGSRLTDLDAATCIEKDIVRFDVTVDDVLRMKVFKTLSDLRPN